MKTSLLTAVLCIFIAYSTLAQGFKLQQNHETGIYKSGEKILVTAILNRKTNDSLLVKIWKNNDQLFLKSGILP